MYYTNITVWSVINFSLRTCPPLPIISYNFKYGLPRYIIFILFMISYLSIDFRTTTEVGSILKTSPEYTPWSHHQHNIRG